MQDQHKMIYCDLIQCSNCEHGILKSIISMSSSHQQISTVETLTMPATNWILSFKQWDSTTFKFSSFSAMHKPVVVARKESSLFLWGLADLERCRLQANRTASLQLVFLKQTTESNLKSKRIKMYQHIFFPCVEVTCTTSESWSKQSIEWTWNNRSATPASLVSYHPCDPS